MRATPLLCALTLLSVTACDREKERDPTQWPISREDLERNAPTSDPDELTYRRYCIGCHGSDGHGNGGVTGADLAATDGPLLQKNDAALIASVRDGKKGAVASMPAHRPVLDDAQIAGVVGYVRKRFGQVTTPPKTALTQPPADLLKPSKIEAPGPTPSDRPVR